MTDAAVPFTSPQELQILLESMGILRPTELTRMAGGWDSTVWLVVDQTGRYVLRILPEGTRNQALREREAMEAARSGGLPVPHVFDIDVRHSRPALLIEWLPGSPAALAVRRQPHRLRQIGMNLGRLQARMHRIELGPDMESVGDDWIGWAEGRQDIQEAMRACACRNRLVHFDYHPANVLMDMNGPTAIIDWANCQAGDPRADLARSIAFLHLAPRRPGLLEMPSRALQKLLASAWLRGYAEEAGEADDMALFFAWAGAVLLRDFSRQIGNGAARVRPQHVHAAERWVEYWTRRIAQ